MGKTKAPETIRLFMKYLVDSKHLPIGSLLPELEKAEPFFLVAATGLGKTVVVPVALLLRNMQDPTRSSLQNEQEHLAAASPRIWVVEPKIAICQGMEVEMNATWERWHRQTFKDAPALPLFGCKTKVDHRHVQAPIMFITTGIFAIYARKGMFKAGQDTVIMDEAHVTLESDESVELGVAICRMKGVDIHYMSATVDTTGLSERLNVRMLAAQGKRYPVWIHNTRRAMEDCIEELVEKTLVKHDLSSAYFPKRGTVDNIVASVTESQRTKGMLIIVNSFASERSDAKRIERILRKAPYADQIEIGLLASEVLRDARRREAYLVMLERWKRERKRYVLIATSVVEMGVTLPDLDFIVTMDSGFNDAQEGGKLERVALGMNALIQRIGRVGRVRPGIAYITKEVNAPYASLDDEKLNAPGALSPEPIRFPMERGSLIYLAYYSLEKGWSWTKLVKMLGGKLPLGQYANLTEEDDPWLIRLECERNWLMHLGLATRWPKAGLTKEGKNVERWIGRTDITAATLVMSALEKSDLKRVIASLCLCALAVVPFEQLLRESSGDLKAKKKWLMIAFVSYIEWIHFDRANDLHGDYSRAEFVGLIVERLAGIGMREDMFFRLLLTWLEFSDLTFEISEEVPIDEELMHALGDIDNALTYFLKNHS